MGEQMSEPLRKQIGVKINAELWWELRKVAFDEGKTATESLEAAMREYIEKHSSTPYRQVDPPAEVQANPADTFQKYIPKIATSKKIIKIYQKMEE
jgi:hypothetical protein